MRDSKPTLELIVHTTAVDAAAGAIQLVMQLPTPLRSLADQVVRAASSVAANLAEGAGRAGKSRAYHYRIAYGSAKEVDSLLRLLVRTGAIDRAHTESALSLFDEVRAMTWRLLNPR